jgi:long-subunit fatty acid transport protein/photosystem II stability/assembly factor-like uncharacterized protein
MTERGQQYWHFINLIFIFIVAIAEMVLSISTESLAADDFTNLGLYGGQINDIAINPTSPSTVFAASSYGDGLFITSDSGNSWQAVEAGNVPAGQGTFKNHLVFGVETASPPNANIVWAVHNEWAEKSMDGGQTWGHFSNDIMQRDCAGCGGEGDDWRFCQAVAIDPNDPQIVYIGAGGPDNSYTSGAIYKTADGGVTWTKLNQGNDFDYPVQDLAIDPQNSNNIWAVTSSEGKGGWGGTLYRSGNGGDTWEEIFSLTPYGMGYLSVAVKPNDSNTVFTGSAAGIILHQYDGSKWVFAGQPCSSVNCWPVSDIVFDPHTPETVYAVWRNDPLWGGDGIGKVGRSTDGGGTWDVFALGTSQVDTYDFKTITVHPTNSEILFAGEFNEGVFTSKDHGQSWSMINDGINAVKVYDVAVDPKDSSHIIAGTFSGVYERTGAGDWSQILRDATRSVLFHPTDSLTLYAGLEGFLKKSTDGGATWTQSNNLGGSYLNWVSNIAVDKTATDTIFAAVASGVWKSVDGGSTFVKVLDGINQSGESYPFNAVAIDPQNFQHVYAGGGSFYAPKVVGDFWKSTDGGVNWDRTGLTDTIVNAILVDPENSNVLYAGTGYSGGTDTPLYKSTDDGSTWTASAHGIPLAEEWNSVTDLAFYHQDSDIIYASTVLQGIYVSSNRAVNWLNLGTPVYDVNAIAPGSLYSATEGGLLQLTGTGLLYGKITDSISQSFINDAIVYTDTGEPSISINGEYMMVCPSGNYDITAVAAGHENMTKENITVVGGGVTSENFPMESGISDPNLALNGGSLAKPSGGGCFINTITDCRSLMKGKSLTVLGFSRLLILKSVICLGLFCLFILVGLLFRTKIISSLWMSHGRIKKKSACIKNSFTLFLFLGPILLAIADFSQAATIFQQVGVASSPNPVGSGARAVGMGGAFIAIADDATAASWNPAGLIQLERPEVSIVGAYGYRKETFSSGLHPEIANTGDVDDVGINYFSASVPFRLFQRNMVSSINYQRLYDFKRSFHYNYDYSLEGPDLMGDNQYGQDGFIGALGLATAVQITPALSIGMTLNLWTHRLFWENGWDESYTQHDVGTTGGVPTIIDTVITDKYSRFRGVNANIGLLWNINEHFTLGAVMKTPFNADLFHEFTYRQTQTVATTPPTVMPFSLDFSENIKLHMPWSYGLGLAFRVFDALSFALDLYRTDWGDYILTDSQGNKFSPIDGRPQNLSNVSATNQVRLGGEYLFIGEKYVVPVRGGIFYDPEPSEGSTKDFFGLAAGTGIVFDKFCVDIAYEFRWGNNVDTGNLIATSGADVHQHRLLSSVIVYF